MLAGTCSPQPPEWLGLEAVTTPIIFVFFVERGFYHVGQASLKLLTSDDPLVSNSVSAGIIGVVHHASPSFSLLKIF